MNQINCLILEGNVCNDVLFKEPDFNVAVFTVACNRKYKTEKGERSLEISYFDCEAYGNLAEFCRDKLTRGAQVRIVGRLKQEQWRDEDGKLRSKVYVIAEHIERKFQGGKND